MKKLAKIFVILLAMMLMLTMTACGKSEEEQVQSEIYEHMKEEAAADGVDLDALLESEYQAYQEESAQKQQEREELSDFTERVKAMIPALSDAYTRYTTATSGNEIIAAAEDYNRTYEACLDLAADENEMFLVLGTIRSSGTHCDPILKSVYLGKATLADAEISPEYTEGLFHYDPESDDFKFVFTRFNEAYQKEFLVLLPDGSTYIPDLSGIKELNPSSWDGDGVTKTSVIITVIANAEWLKFEFPLDGSVPTGNQIPFDQPESGYEAWMLWGANLDEFNAAEN